MYEADIEVKGEKRTTKYHIPAGATLFITDGMEVAKGFKWQSMLHHLKVIAAV